MQVHLHELYVNCKACGEAGRQSDHFAIVVYDGVLMIICKHCNEPVLTQDWQGPAPECDACKEEEND